MPSSPDASSAGGFGCGGASSLVACVIRTLLLLPGSFGRGEGVRCCVSDI